MENVLIVIHLLVVIALVVVVLLQRSEGGGLGIGGGGGGAMSARGKADTLTRTTAILAAAFFVTSISLGVIARYGDSPTSILNRIGNAPADSIDGAPVTGDGVLDLLGGEEPADNAAPAVPTE